eukprot:10819565-Karenia_brevis.AAC.1
MVVEFRAPTAEVQQSCLLPKYPWVDIFLLCLLAFPPVLGHLFSETSKDLRKAKESQGKDSLKLSTPRRLATCRLGVLAVVTVWKVRAAEV